MGWLGVRPRFSFLWSLSCKPGWQHEKRGLTPALCAACLLASCAMLPPIAQAGSPHVLLEKAVSEYRSALDCSDRGERLAKFRRAELLFARLIKGDPEEAFPAIRNADLYVNLGNAALGAERLGPAILAFRRALQLDPDHPRGVQNLRHARSLLPEWVPRPSEGSLLDTFSTWSDRLAQSEILFIAAGTFLVASILLACSIRWRQTAFRNLAVIPAVAWLLLILLVLFARSGDAGDAAVVTVPEVIARSADSSGAPARLPQPLPGGTELEVVETRDDWTRVRLFDSREAWLPTSATQLVKTTKTTSDSVLER